MAQRTRLEDSLRWKTLRTMEGEQHQADVARWLNLHRSVPCRVWLQFLELENVSQTPEQSGIKKRLQLSGHKATR